MNKQMITLADKAGTRVEADIVGQLGIHDNESFIVEAYVTHVKSGCLIAAFSWYDDAVSFAHRITGLMDFDAYALAIAQYGPKVAKRQFAAQIDAVTAIRDSYTTTMNEVMQKCKGAGRKIIRQRLAKS